MPARPSLVVEPHPLLELAVLVAELPAPLGTLATPSWLLEGLTLDAMAPVESSDAVRADVRALLRHGGYKPAGRGKPASEFLLRAAGEGKLASINLAVDLCNVTSLHSGLPISVVDLDRVRTPLRVAVAEAEASYVFNASGQEIRLAGLLCLHDADGPCANAVKDSQRTKTHPGTLRTLALMWGPTDQRTQVRAALDWYATLHERAGASVEAWIAVHAQ
jgi:DNA/RNA-binding domain of Phe-tRNA-synthetase-like protein